MNNKAILYGIQSVGGKTDLKCQKTRNIITIPRKSNKIQAENVSNKRHDINQKTFNNIKDIRNRNVI